MSKHRIYTTSFASVYPHYVAKAQKKGRTQAEVDQIICWLTGHSQETLQATLDAGTDFETFFADAPAMNPGRTAITGTICGVRIEQIEEPVMREIRYLDKLIEELARGRQIERILGRRERGEGTHAAQARGPNRREVTRRHRAKGHAPGPAEKLHPRR